MRPIFFTIASLGVLLLTVCSKCELAMDHSYVIDLINEADHPIGYYFGDGGKYGTYYPDSLPKTNDYVMYNIDDVISPGIESHLSWDKYFETLPYDTLSLFIFHTDTLNMYSWDEIRDDYKILKRYVFSYDDLERMDWTITYP
jgi:hypothetical protein